MNFADMLEESYAATHRYRREEWPRGIYLEHVAVNAPHGRGHYLVVEGRHGVETHAPYSFTSDDVVAKWTKVPR